MTVGKTFTFTFTFACTMSLTLTSPLNYTKADLKHAPACARKYVHEVRTVLGNPDHLRSILKIHRTRIGIFKIPLESMSWPGEKQHLQPCIR